MTQQQLKRVRELLEEARGFARWPVSDSTALAAVLARLEDLEAIDKRNCNMILDLIEENNRLRSSSRLEAKP